MRPQDQSRSSTASPTDNKLPQNPGVVVQDGDLLTAAPPSERRGTDVYTTAPKADQKILSPTQPVLAQLDSQGGIRINITVPASALTLGKLLGEGAYGSVYEGLWNDQAVAIKRLKAQHLTEKAVEELRQEAQIMFQLGVESKYIVPLKKICLESPHYSLVMELMPNGSLYHLLHNGQDLPWTLRFQIALDTAWGLKDLHGYSILHRDLKSLNILLDDRLRAKLADFGLAKVKQETSSQSTLAKGTVLWMAPELFKRKAEVTAAADIWSLGMVLWELAARQIPFKDAQNQLQAMGWIKDGEKEEIPGDCPPGLKTIIESCWNLMPTERPTAIQVVERLKPLVTPADSELKAELKRSQEKTELKPPAQPITTPTKPLPIPVSQIIPQTLMPAPKPAASSEQLQLQDQLIAACKQGDEKAVTVLFQRGAKPDIPNTKGEQPLGAAVWGMCPGVVNALLKQAGGVAPMTWDECEKHNLKYYKEVFIVPKFNPQTFGEWHQLLQKMDPNTFVRACHLKKADEHWISKYSTSWDTLKRCVGFSFDKSLTIGFLNFRVGWLRDATETEYVGFRTQIKQGVRHASTLKNSQESEQRFGI